MPSDELYRLLAEAKSKPSRAYRTATAALGIPEQALEGYLKGGDIADKIQQRRQAQMTLEQILGGVVPERIRPYGKLRPSTINELGGFKALSELTETPKSSVDNSLDELLAKEVREGRTSLSDAYDLKNSGALLRGGMMQGPGRTLVPVPGGKVAIELEEKEEKKKAAMQTDLESSKLVIGKIDEALSDVGPWTAGPGGALLRHVAGTPAKNLDKTLNTVRANVGFETLARMRQNSPTGGALGAISDRENKLLQDVRGSLDQEQGIPQLIKNLQDLRTHYSNVVLAIENQTKDPEANDAIAQIIGSSEPEAKKRILIQAVRARANQ